MTIKKCIAYMEDKVKHSHMLWLHVNRYILRVLRSKKSRKIMARRLNNFAGPKKKNEPSCLCNIRGAAKDILAGREMCVL